MHSGAATCWPIRPLNADVPLRLKSPSSPCPTASCSSTPGQPGPSTTVIVPAGAGTASRLTCAVRTASRTSARQRSPAAELGVREPAAAARISLLAPSLVLDDHRHVEPHQRPHVGRKRAVAREHHDRLVRRGQARHDLADARIECTRLAVDLLEQAHLVAVVERVDRIDRQIQLAPAARMPGLQCAGRAAARDRARSTRGLEQRRQHDLVRVGEPRALARERAHADTAVDAVRAVLDDAVLERPGLLAHRLKIDVRVVDRVPHHLAQDAGDAVLVERGRRQDRAAGVVERVGVRAVADGNWLGANIAGGIGWLIGCLRRVVGGSGQGNSA